MAANRLIVISGCSGGGKSTLIAELSRRGYATMAEPGRRIVKDELAHGGRALPWIDMEAFARRALKIATADMASAQRNNGLTFFDRGLIDAAVALEHAAGAPAAQTLRGLPRYHDTVFLTPPWPEIHTADDARRHDMKEAEAEYDRLCVAFPALGYTVDILPRAPVSARADWLLSSLK